jgi:hypothetical protein
MPLRFTIVAAAMLAATCLIRPAFACSCAEPAPELAYDRAAAVFVGTVAGIERSFTDWLGITRSIWPFIHFTVTRRWKGAAGAVVTIRAPLTGEACGYPFREGETYLVYAVGGARLTSGYCAGTKELSLAAKDVEILDALHARE